MKSGIDKTNIQNPKKIIVVLLQLVFSTTLTFSQQTFTEPKNGRVYFGTQTMDYDPLAGYFNTLSDSTIRPAVSGFLNVSTDTLVKSAMAGEASSLTWDKRFGFPGVSGEVYSMVTMGNDLYVAGRFSCAGDANLDSLSRGKGSIARWDGTSWHSLGSNIGGYVFALAVKDSVLYAAGRFSGGNILRWDGHSWSGVGGGFNTFAKIYALEFIGPDLYAGGEFTTAGGIDAQNIAKWDGSNWSAIGNGVSNELGSSCYVHALASIGQDLYVGGLFTHAGDVNSTGIARWDGNKWNATGSGTSAAVLALEVMDNDLYAGGAFVQAGGIDVYGIAKWNGTQWSALGIGMNYDVTSLTVIEDKLFAGGWFFDAGGVYASCVASWDGVQWSALDKGIYGNIGQLSSRVLTLTSMGTDLFAGGYFTVAGNSGASNVAKWNGSEWSGLGSGKGIIGDVKAIAVHGSDIYAGGSFTLSGNTGANNIAKWDGIKWSVLGDGVNYGGIDCLAFLGTDLYAGGKFFSAGSVDANGLARWDGNQWSALPGNHFPAEALLSTGSELYIGAFYFVSIWNGIQWTDIAEDIDGSISAFGKIGADLYAAGNFSKIGEVNANSIARWNGDSWAPLGAGLTHEDGNPGNVYSIAVLGNDIYVSGAFDRAGETAVGNIARWDGINWYNVGWFNTSTFTMAVIGNELYVIGTNQDLFKYDGTNWIDLCNDFGNGFNASVLAMAASGNELWFGGIFSTAGKNVSASIAHCTGLTTFINMEKVQESEVVLEQNFPNPFGSSTQIRFYIPKPAMVTVKIFSLSGEDITTLLSKELPAGYHMVEWTSGECPSGIYFCQMETNESLVTKMLLLLK